MSQETTCKAAPEKKEVVKQIIALGKKYPIIGIVNMEGLPASNLLKMKKQLRGKMELVMCRKTLMQLALKDLKLQNGEEVINNLKGMPALMFTEENPFSLYKTIKKSKTPAPAKPGQEAPFDITVPAGPTPFGPGPIISEFAQLGIPAGVEEGKVAIKKDTTVVKEGETISAPLAGMLQRLGIEPMEVGLNLHAVYEDGTIFPRSVLDIDEDEFMANLAGAASGAFNLAVEVGHFTPETVETMLSKAAREARSVGVEGNIMAADLVEDILAKAERQATSLKSEANIQ